MSIEQVQAAPYDGCRNVAEDYFLYVRADGVELKLDQWCPGSVPVLLQNGIEEAVTYSEENERGRYPKVRPQGRGWKFAYYCPFGPDIQYWQRSVWCRLYGKEAAQ